MTKSHLGFGRPPIWELDGGESGEWGHHPAVISDEPSIKISKAQEALQVFAVLRQRTVGHRSHLRGVGPHLSTLDDETEKVQGCDVKLALLCLNV